MSTLTVVHVSFCLYLENSLKNSIMLIDYMLKCCVAIEEVIKAANSILFVMSSKVYLRFA